MTDDDTYAVARIFAAGSSLQHRRLSEAYCPDCGKLVAAIVVYREELWFWLVGGRSGSHRVLIEEIERTISDRQLDIEECTARGDQELLQIAEAGLKHAREWLKRAMGERRPGYTPGTASRIQSALQFPGTAEYLAACRGCRRDVVLRVSMADGVSVSRQDKS